MNKLYHRSIYWKDSFNADISDLLSKPYKYSHHALERLHEPNRSHKIGMDELDLAIDIIKTKNVRAFECEVDNVRIIKFVIRVKLGDKCVIVVFANNGDYLMVKTYYVNKCDDFHATLNKSKYQSN